MSNNLKLTYLPDGWVEAQTELDKIYIKRRKIRKLKNLCIFLFSIMIGYSLSYPLLKIIWG